MTLKEFFTTADGFGVLSTADAEGRVDAAVYAKPHVFDDGSLGFVMRARLTHSNLQENSSAVYLFAKAGGGYRGVRLYLRKTGEDTDDALIQEMTRSWLSAEEDEAKGPKYLVRFAVEKVLPLIGDGASEIDL